MRRFRRLAFWLWWVFIGDDQNYHDLVRSLAHAPLEDQMLGVNWGKDVIFGWLGIKWVNLRL